MLSLLVWVRNPEGSRTGSYVREDLLPRDLLVTTGVQYGGIGSLEEIVGEHSVAKVTGFPRAFVIVTCGHDHDPGQIICICLAPSSDQVRRKAVTFPGTRPAKIHGLSLRSHPSACPFALDLAAAEACVEKNDNSVGRYGAKPGG